MNEDSMPQSSATTQLIVGLARALHESGVPSHRLEDTLEAVCRALGVDVAVFATPTSLMLQVDGQTHMLRVSPKENNLSRLVAVDALGAALSRNRRTVEQALRRLKLIEKQKEGPYPAPVMGIALALSSAMAALLFGGPAIEALLAGSLAGLLSLLSGRMARNPHHARIAHLVSGDAHRALGRPGISLLANLTRARRAGRPDHLRPWADPHHRHR